VRKQGQPSRCRSRWPTADHQYRCTSKAWGHWFVVFRKPTSETAAFHSRGEARQGAPLRPYGLWPFRQVGCAPNSIKMDQLLTGARVTTGVNIFWNRNLHGDVRASPEWFGKGAKLWIDLGRREESCCCYREWQGTGEAWHAPYRLVRRPR